MKLYCKKYIGWILFLFVLLLSVSCGSPNENGNVLTYASLSAPNANTRQMISKFNRSHPEIQIIVNDYSIYDVAGSSAHNGLEKLLTEIAAGQVPDLIDFGGNDSTGILPYQRLAEKGYLEDLWPYIEDDPDLGRESLMEAPLKAAEVNGGLFQAFDKVWINTLIGAERVVGDRNSWTLPELLETFDTMPDGATITGGFTTKYDMLRCAADVNSYVDWETGQCFFDSKNFRTTLEFVNRFPLEIQERLPDGDEILTSEEWAEQDAEKVSRIRSGLQMLEEFELVNFSAIANLDDIFGERVALIGYPVEDGSTGSQFYTFGHRLAISSACKNKEAAWAFVRQLFLPKYDISPEQIWNTPWDKREGLRIDLFGFPINRSDFEALKAYEMSMPYDEETVKSYALRGERDYPPVTEEQCQRVLKLYESIQKIKPDDGTIYQIVQEQCGPYFAGDRTLDETVNHIQQRVSLYVNETR